MKGVLTSRWKMSATFTREKLGALTSGLWCVLAERAKVKEGGAKSEAPEPQSPGTQLARAEQVTRGMVFPVKTSRAWLPP